MNSAAISDFQSPTAVEKAKKRQSNRDAAIRKRFLTTQSPQSNSQQRGRNKATKSSTAVSSALPAASSISLSAGRPGTVQSMQPAYPIILSETTTIVEVARTMAGRRVDAVLITDAQGHGELRGIVTDKDLTFRCVAEGLEANRVRVGQIMTRDPVYVSSTASVDEAMNLMLNGHFRHLPVVDDDKITGLLDITKVLMHIQGKIHQYWGKAQALKEAFRDFQATWQNFTVTPQVDAWFKDWEEKMVEPDLTHVMDSTKMLPEIGCKTNVLEAARKMRECRQTAVLVFDSDRELTGIFTTKDICLRVLATNELDPRSTSVVRVMTPHPDCGSELMTVRAALDKMHMGHYLHLPVRSASGHSVIGLVDVLELTYLTMNQLLRQQLVRPSAETVNMGQEGANGPMWSQFWDAMDTADSHTVISPVKKQMVDEDMEDSASVQTPSQHGSQASVIPNAASSQFFVFKFRDPLNGTTQRFTINTVYNDVQSPLAELLTSVAKQCGVSLVLEDDTVDGRGFDGDYETDLSPEDREDDDATVCHSTIASHLAKRQNLKHTKMLLKQYQLHRLLKLQPNVAPQLLINSQIQSMSPSHSLFMRLSYRDDENDWVSFFSDVELLDAISMARINNWARLVLRMELFLTDASIPGGIMPLVPSQKEGSPVLIPCLSDETAAAHLKHINDDDNDSLDISPVLSQKEIPHNVQKQNDLPVGLYLGAAGWIVGAIGLGIMVANRFK